MTPPNPHSPEWYDRLAHMQTGYHYPWQSTLPPYNGEDVYLTMLEEHFSPNIDVLDVACGHGEVALDVAPRCRSVFAYDRIPSYIELAQTAARERGLANATFLCGDSSIAANEGQARIPAEADSFDLLISRRGPLHWLEDAKRVARNGATLLQLNPVILPPPSWNGQLPERLRLPEPGDYVMRQTVEHRLGLGGLRLHSAWSFEVPEIFAEPAHLYAFLSWGYTPDEVPAYGEVAKIIESIFSEHAGSDGLALRFARLLWKAVVHKE